MHQYQSEAPRLQSSLCRHHDITLLAEFSGNCAVARIGKTYPKGKVIGGTTWARNLATSCLYKRLLWPAWQRAIIVKTTTPKILRNDLRKKSRKAFLLTSLMYKDPWRFGDAKVKRSPPVLRLWGPCKNWMNHHKEIQPEIIQDNSRM